MKNNEEWAHFVSIMLYNGSTMHILMHVSIIIWLFPVLRPAQEFLSNIWRHRSAASFSSMHAQHTGPSRREIFECPTLAMTQGLVLSSLIRRTAPWNRLIRLAGKCGRPILTWILTGSHEVASLSDTQGDAKSLF
jgi:hypothetical protein